MNVVEGKFKKEEEETRNIASALPALVEAIESGEYTDMVILLEGEESAFMTTMTIAETYFALGIMQKVILDANPEGEM